MGKGDKKTKKGKINIGSFGASRPHKKKVKVNPPSGTPRKKEAKETKDKKAK